MTSVFVSVVGQNDNLGDSVLRRGLLQAARLASNSATHVFVGSNDDDYLTAVGLDGTETLHRSKTSWRSAVVRSLLSERTIFGFNAGEVVISRDAAHLGWSAALSVALARLRGGGGFHTGIGVRSPGMGSPLSLRVLLRLCTLVSWRDEPSRDSVGRGSVAPDWAFGEVGHSVAVAGSERAYVVVTMRGDRPAPSDVWLAGVKAFALDHLLAVVVASQVTRDNERAGSIAAALGATRLLKWQPEVSHQSWEAELRLLYGNAAAVISDRLHALIIGATEGAMPIGLSDSSVEKLERTLAPSGLHTSALQVGAMTGSDLSRRLATIYDGRSELGNSVLLARQHVARLASDINRRIAS